MILSSVRLELKVYQLRIDNIDIYTDLSPDIPNTMADTYSLQQVFLNLINNAHLAMVDKKTPGVLSIKSEQVNGVIRDYHFRYGGWYR